MEINYIEGPSIKCSSGFGLGEWKRGSEDLNLRAASNFTLRALHLSEIVACTSTHDMPATLAVGISFCLEWLAPSSLIRDSLDSLIVKSAVFRFAPRRVGAYFALDSPATPAVVMSCCLECLPSSSSKGGIPDMLSTASK